MWREAWTYNDPRDSNTEDETVGTQDPNVVLALDDPLRDSDLVFTLLRSIRVTVFCQVLPRDFVRQCLVRPGELYILPLGVFLRLVLSKLDLIRMASLCQYTPRANSWQGEAAGRLTIEVRASCNAS